MKLTQVDARAFKNALTAGANALVARRDEINALNVFPVPDGDTGTNMSLTFLAAVREAGAVTTDNVNDIAKATSSGALRGARGNSGVILSQLFRGFSRGLSSGAAAEAFTAKDLEQAFAGSTQAAYSAVMKPREGTILTIARAMSERAAKFCKNDPDSDDIIKMLDAVLEHARKVLLQTTDMLPELKAAGVVDAGGEGLLVIWEGALEALKSGEDVVPAEDKGASAPSSSAAFVNTADIEFAYCTEFIITEVRASSTLENDMKSYLAKHGDSVVVVHDDDIVKAHVHTNNPGKILEYALTIGPLSNIKIDNMREQHTEMTLASAPANAPSISAAPVVQLDENIGFIAVASGNGFADIFSQLGVSRVIEGGQSMNPSTEDILKAAAEIPARDIFVLPNNKNIILAAKQAAELVTDKRLHVLNTKSVPQGIAAMIAFIAGVSAEENFKQMDDASNAVTTGQVTYAVRDTEWGETTISEGDILGLVENKIVTSAKTVNDGAMQVIETLNEGEPELLSIFVGQDVSEEDAQALVEACETKFPDIEVELHIGGQPLYYYIFSAE